MKETYNLERDLPYIDVEAMDDNKMVNIALNTPPLKLKDLKEKLKKDREKKKNTK